MCACMCMCAVCVGAQTRRALRRPAASPVYPNNTSAPHACLQRQTSCQMQRRLSSQHRSGAPTALQQRPGGPGCRCLGAHSLCPTAGCSCTHVWYVAADARVGQRVRRRVQVLPGVPVRGGGQRPKGGGAGEAGEGRGGSGEGARQWRRQGRGGVLRTTCCGAPRRRVAVLQGGPRCRQCSVQGLGVGGAWPGLEMLSLPDAHSTLAWLLARPATSTLPPLRPRPAPAPFPCSRPARPGPGPGPPSVVGLWGHDGALPCRSWGVASWPSPASASATSSLTWWVAGGLGPGACPQLALCVQLVWAWPGQKVLHRDACASAVCGDPAVYGGMGGGGEGQV